MRNGTGVESEPEDVPAEQAMDFEQDALHANNPQYCVDYVHEIFEHLIASENKLLPSSAYMETVLRPAPLPRHHQAPYPPQWPGPCCGRAKPEVYATDELACTRLNLYASIRILCA